MRLELNSGSYPWNYLWFAWLRDKVSVNQGENSGTLDDKLEVNSTTLYKEGKEWHVKRQPS